MSVVRSIIIALCLVLCLSGASLADVTEPGAAIRNQATLTYLDNASGETVEVLSNASTVFVGELRQFALEQSQSVSGFSSEAVALPHRVTNTGNITDSYTITTQPVVLGEPELLNIQFYVDENENGRVDAGEPLLGASFDLAPGDSLPLVISGVIPPQLHDSSVLELLVIASTADGQFTQENQDTINVTPHAS